MKVGAVPRLLGLADGGEDAGPFPNDGWGPEGQEVRSRRGDGVEPAREHSEGAGDATGFLPGPVQGAVPLPINGGSGATGGVDAQSEHEQGDECDRSRPKRVPALLVAGGGAGGRRV